MSSQKGLKAFCPRCGAAVLVFEGNREIEWDDDKKAFHVKLLAQCRGCAEAFEVELGSLPLLIAQHSRCSCGSELGIKKYNLKQKGKDVEFEAIYQCDKCNTTKHKVVRGFVEGISKIWRDTKSVEVGPDGIKYEKVTK